MAVELSARTKTIPLDLLEMAIREGDVAVVKDFLKTTTDTNLVFQDQNDYTPLHLAASYNQLEVAKILLADERTNPDAVSESGASALDVAVTSGASFEVVSLLADQIFNKDMDKLLSAAIVSGCPKTVKYFIDAGASVDPIVPCAGLDVLPLFAAIKRNDPEIVEVLINAGANVNRPNNHGDSPLSYAIVNGFDLNLITLLIKSGADVNYDNGSNWTVLMSAVDHKRVAAALELLNHNAYADTVGVCFTALHLSLTLGDPELLRRLISATSLDVLESLCEAGPYSGLFSCAVTCGHKDTLSLLLGYNFTEPIVEAPEFLHYFYRGVWQTLTTLFDEDFANRLRRYCFAGPVCLLLIEGFYKYRGSITTLLQQMISKGFSVEPIDTDYMPPLVGLLLSPLINKSMQNNDLSPYRAYRKSVLEVLFSANVNVDYMIDVLPEALITAVKKQDCEAVSLLLPFSRYTPCAIAKIGIKHKMDYLTIFILTNIRDDDYTSLWPMRDDAEFNAVCAPFIVVVPSLKAIARQRIRQCLPETKTSAEFVKVVNALDLPACLLNYVRYSL